MTQDSGTKLKYCTFPYTSVVKRALYTSPFCTMFVDLLYNVCGSCVHQTYIQVGNPLLSHKGIRN